MDYCWTLLSFLRWPRSMQCMGVIWVYHHTGWSQGLLSLVCCPPQNEQNGCSIQFALMYLDLPHCSQTMGSVQTHSLLVWLVRSHLEQVKWLGPDLVQYRILTVGDGVSFLYCVGILSTLIGFHWVPGGVVVCSYLIGGPILLGGCCLMKLFRSILVDSSGVVWYDVLPVGNDIEGDAANLRFWNHALWVIGCGSSLEGGLWLHGSDGVEMGEGVQL